MLAFIIIDGGQPVTYVRGSKPVVVNRAKELVKKLNARETDGIPKSLTSLYKDNPKFQFKILQSIDELK